LSKAKILIIVKDPKVVSFLRKLSPFIKEEGKKEFKFDYSDSRNWRKRYKGDLALIRSFLEKGKIELVCGCTKHRPPKMTIVKRKSLYHLRTFKNQTYKHSLSCPFHVHNVVSPKDFRRKLESKVPASLLVVRERERARKVNKEDLVSIKAPNRRKRFTFSGFCRGLIDKVQARSFNYLNKNKHRKDPGDLSMPTVKMIKSSLEKEIERRVPKGFSYIVDLITRENIDVNRDNIIIRIPRTDEEVVVERYKIFGWDIEETGFSSSRGNFLLILFKDKRGKPTKVFLLPVLYIEGEATFVPIESLHEAEFAERLINENFKFLKIVTGSPVREYARLGFTKYDDFGCVKDILENSIYQPDFIIFMKEKILILELLGFPKDRKYRKLKDEVRKEFLYLGEKYKCDKFLFDAVKDFDEFKRKYG